MRELLWVLAPYLAHAAGGGVSKLAGTITQESVLTFVTVGTLLVMFSISVEKAKHLILHIVPKHLAAIVDSVLMEMTNTGLISIVLYLLESSKVLNDLSYSIFDDEYFLPHVFHEVHIMIFLVMMIYFLLVFCLVIIAVQLGKTWHHLETMATDNEGNFRSQKPPCYKTLMHAMCCFVMETPSRITKEALCYSVLRRRFIEGELQHQKDELIEDLDIQAMQEGHALELVLNKNNSSIFRKKDTVIAIQVDAPLKIDKHWGKSEGHRGDYLVRPHKGERGETDTEHHDVYMVSKDIFDTSYERVKDTQNEYRKVLKVYGTLLHYPFVAVTTNKDGKMSRSKGPAGSYLLQNINNMVSEEEIQDLDATDDDVHTPRAPDKMKGLVQYVVSASDFKATYEPVDEIKDKNTLLKDFNFALYLNFWLASRLCEIVEVSPWAWFMVECILLVHWGIFEAIGLEFFDTFIQAVAGIGGVGLVILGICLRLKARWIRNQLTPAGIDYALVKGTDKRQGNSAKVNPTPPPKDDEKNTPRMDIGYEIKDFDTVPDLLKLIKRQPPKYLEKSLKKRSKCEQKIIGRPGNLHEQLFWLDHNGPHAFINFFTTLVLLTSLYISSLLMYLVSPCGVGGDAYGTSASNETAANIANGTRRLLAAAAASFDPEVAARTPLECGLTMIPVIVPSLVVLSMLPPVLKDYVVITGIEKMKQTSLVAKVKRQQAVSRSVRALKLLAAMKIRMKREEKQNQEGMTRKQTLRRQHTTTKGAASKAWTKGSTHYAQRRKELHEAFLMFDRDGSGTVENQDMFDLLRMIGMGGNDAEDLKKLTNAIEEEMDYDGTGDVEFEEFFDWVAMQEASTEDNSHELVKYMFKVIDHDGSGEITSSELKTALTSLGGAMSNDDVMAIVREADENGDGTIDFHEFTKMIKNSLSGGE